jgi:paraquat-inducible protein B
MQKWLPKRQAAGIRRMSDQRRVANPDTAPGSDRQKASVRLSRWPGWIWAVPIAVLIVVGWLGVRALLSGKEDITIRFDDAHGLKDKSTYVEYRGAHVGEVKKVELSGQGDAVTVTVSIDRSAKQFMKSGTRFWLRGASPSLEDPQSLSAVLTGPSIVMEPGPKDRPGKKTDHFMGLSRKPISPFQNAPALLYAVRFNGEAGALKRGDPVKLHGFTVGEVLSTGFDFDASSGDISMPGTLALYPALFQAQGAPGPPSTAAVRTEVGLLIQKGLHVRLEQQPPLVGSYTVTLDLLPNPTDAAPAPVNGLPQIPAAAGGGISSIVTRINKIPLEQIARNVLDITQHVQAITASPRLKDAVNQLDAALREIHQTTAKAGPEVTALVAKLRKASDDLDGTVKSANGLVTGTATQDGVNTLVVEITEASRAVRSLAEYLDEHPEALVKGRSSTELQ